MQLPCQAGYAPKYPLKREKVGKLWLVRAMGAVFHRIGELKTAVYWWQLAAASGHVIAAAQMEGLLHRAMPK